MHFLECSANVQPDLDDLGFGQMTQSLQDAAHTVAQQELHDYPIHITRLGQAGLDELDCVGRVHLAHHVCLSPQAAKLLIRELATHAVNHLDRSPYSPLPVVELPCLNDDTESPGARNLDRLVLLSKLVGKVALVRQGALLCPNEPSACDSRRSIPEKAQPTDADGKNKETTNCPPNRHLSHQAVFRLSRSNLYALNHTRWKPKLRK
mmetsp:Transcript_36401/g.95731  ORF Transcript_36401/g.95731 Transcript_36401/m.95731 type:complete len:207 (-) Transcript_36401:1086-1706(-)